MLQKKPIQILNLNVGIIVFSKLVKTKTSSKYLIGRKFDKVIRLLVLIMSKISGYVKDILKINSRLFV